MTSTSLTIPSSLLGDTTSLKDTLTSLPKSLEETSINFNQSGGDMNTTLTSIPSSLFNETTTQIGGESTMTSRPGSLLQTTSQIGGESTMTSIPSSLLQSTTQVRDTTSMTSTSLSLENTTQVGGNIITTDTSNLTSDIPESLYIGTKLQNNTFSLTSLPTTLKLTSQAYGTTNLSEISEQSSYSSYDSDYQSGGSQNNAIDFENTRLSDILSLA